MADSLNFATDPSFQHILHKLFPIELHKEWRTQTRIGQLAAYLLGTESRREQTPEKLAGDVLDAALSECWIILQSQPAALTEAIQEALDEEETIDIEEFAQTVCRKVVLILAGHVADHRRDKNFAGLRQAISRKFPYRTKSAKGVCYATCPVPEGAPTFAEGDKDAFFAKLDKPSQDLRKAQKAAGEPDQLMVWDNAVLEKEATRFWQSYCDTFYGGPGYVPVYDLYCWLCLHLDLLEPKQDDASDVAETYASATSTEDEYAMKETYQAAQDFTTLLASKEKKLCALLFTEELTMEEAARELGYKTASGISRQKQQLIQRLSERASQFDDMELAEFFISSVVYLCKKESLASTKQVEDE